MFVVMNLNRWNALPEDIKRIIEEVSNEWVTVHGEVWDSNDKAGLDFTLSEGNKIIPLTDEENKRWVEGVRPIIDEYITTIEGKGLPGKKAVSTVKALIEKSCK